MDPRGALRSVGGGALLGCFLKAQDAPAVTHQRGRGARVAGVLHVDAGDGERVVQQAHEPVHVVVGVPHPGVAAGLPLLDDRAVRSGEGLGGGQGGRVPGPGRLGGRDQRLTAGAELRPLPGERGQQAGAQGLQVLPGVHALGEFPHGDVGQAVAHGAQQVLRGLHVLADAVRQLLPALLAAGQVVPPFGQLGVHLAGGRLGGLLGDAQEAAQQARHPPAPHAGDAGHAEAGGHQLRGGLEVGGELLRHLLQDGAHLRRHVLLGGGQGLLQLIHGGSPPGAPP